MMALQAVQDLLDQAGQLALMGDLEELEAQEMSAYKDHRVHLVFAVHVLHWAMAIRESSMAQSLEQMTTHWVRMAPQSAQPHPAMTSLWSCPR